MQLLHTGCLILVCSLVQHGSTQLGDTCSNFSKQAALLDDRKGEISLSHMDRLMMDCFSPTFRAFYMSNLHQSEFMSVFIGY